MASCTTSATTDDSVSPSETMDASIASSPFKLDYYFRIMTLLLKDSSTMIGFISECPTQWFVIALSFI